MKQKNILKLTAATFAVIGAGTILFNAAAETVMAANAGKAEAVATSYPVPGNPKTMPTDSAATEESSKKANYHVSMDRLNTGTPTDVDLTMEEAAESGAAHLKNVFGLDLENAFVYMIYNPGTETFMVDAVTGELFNIGYSRHLDANPSLDFDAALEKNYGIYAELAKKKVEECGLIDGPIDSVEYNCQGYAGNDPDITVNVIGINGEIVNVCFSRYDQTFLGLITDTSGRISESALNQILDQVFGEVEYAECH